MQQNIAIIGMASRFPMSPDIETFWQNLLAGRNCICKNERFPDVLKWGGFLDNVDHFDAAFFEIAPQNACTVDPRQRLFLETAYHALEDAGYGGKRACGSKTGVFVGATNNQYALLLSDNCYANKAIDNANAAIANRLSYFMNFRGPSMVVDSTCSSAALALHQAMLSLRSEECEMALVGGVHLLLASKAVIALENMMVVSKNDRNCAFSRNADGFVPGEGVGCVVLKPVNHALKDGDRIYAVIRETGVNYAGKTDGFMRSNPAAQTDLVAGVLQKTQVKAAELHYLELSGTGTVPGDSQEFQAIAQALTEAGGNDDSLCACGTVKNNIGNLDPASGIAALIKVVLTLSRKKIPPLIHASPINRFIRQNSPIYLCEQGKDLPKTHSLQAGMVSFGVTGVNVFALLQQAPKSEAKSVATAPKSRVIAISGHDREALVKNVVCLEKFLREHPQTSLDDICHIANIARGHFGYRLAIVSNSVANLSKKLLWATGLENQPDKNIFVSVAKNDPVISKKKNGKNFMSAYRANTLGKKQKHTNEFYQLSGQPEILFYLPFAHPRSLDSKHLSTLEKFPGYTQVMSDILQELGTLGKSANKFRQNVFICYYALARLLASWGIKPHWLACSPESLPLALAISDRVSPQRALAIQKNNFGNVVIAKESDAAIVLCENGDVPEAIAKIAKSHYFTTETMLADLHPEVIISFASTLAEKFFDRPVFFQPLLEGKFMEMIARLYALKVDIDWENFERNLQGKTISLPAYQFVRKRYWVETRQDKEPKPQEKIFPLRLKANEDIAAALGDFLKQSIASHYGYEAEQIEDNRPLSSYGIDSLFLLSISERLAEKTGISLDAAALFSHSTICGIVSYLCNSPQKLLEALGDEKSAEVKNFAQPKKDTLAVIGMSAQFPGAPEIETFWQNLLQGQVSIGQVPPARWDIEKLYHPQPGVPGKSCSKWAGIIDDLDKFDSAFFDLHPREAGAMDPQQRLALTHAWKAIENAAIPAEKLAGTATGVFVGCSNLEYSARVCCRPFEKITAHDSLGTSHSLIANRISHFLKLKGPSFALDSTCSSATVALHLATQSIALGECEAAIVIGVNLALNASTFISLSRARMLSPSGVCRVFADNADGTVRGEGAAAVLLKPLDQAKRDGDIIYGMIETSAVRYKGESIGITLPSVKSIEDVMTLAWKHAGIGPESISYLELGSFGSKVADPIEFFALKRAFAKYTSRSDFCTLGSLKPNIGHLEAASGMAALIKTLLVAKHGKIPAMLNLKHINPVIDLNSCAFSFNNEPREKSVIHAAFNSLGFGGTMAHVVVRSHTTTLAKSEQCFADVCCISAQSFHSLKQKIADLSRRLTKRRDWSLNDVCYTLNAGRTHFCKYRLAFTATSDNELLQKLADIKEKLSGNNSEKFRLQKSDHLSTVVSEKFPSPKAAAEIASLYRQGAVIDWKNHYRGASSHRIELPSYPFDMKKIANFLA